MVPYTETQTYKLAVDRFVQRVSDLESELTALKLELKGAKRGTTDPAVFACRKRRDSIGPKLKTYKHKLDKLQRLSVPLWDLAELIQDCDCTLWNESQRVLWHKPCAINEGRGEAALRDWHNLPPAAPTSDDCDLPEIDWEAKNVQGKGDGGKFQIQAIQAGMAGRKAYSTWMMLSAEEGKFKGLSEELRSSIGTGELGPNLLFGHFPIELRESLFQAVLPSKVFARPVVIACTTRNGFLVIPACDYDRAWVFKNITKCGPKYVLRRDYLIERLKQSLVVTSVPAAA